MPLLPETAIREALSAMPGWILENGALKRRYLFESYMRGIQFVEAAAVEAEAQDHHPDLLVRYGDVTASCSTHSHGGVTGKDLHLARALDRIAAQYGGR